MKDKKTINALRNFSLIAMLIIGSALFIDYSFMNIYIIIIFTIVFLVSIVIIETQSIHSRSNSLNQTFTEDIVANLRGGSYLKERQFWISITTSLALIYLFQNNLGEFSFKSKLLVFIIPIERLLSELTKAFLLHNKGARRIILSKDKIIHIVNHIQEIEFCDIDKIEWFSDGIKIYGDASQFMKLKLWKYDQKSKDEFLENFKTVESYWKSKNLHAT